MAYQVGALIKDLRLRKGIKQEELAFGIMDRTALSKVERGLSMPSKTNLDALLERLDYTSSLTAEILMTTEEIEIEKLKNELFVYSTQFRFEEAGELVEKLETSKQFQNNKIHQQWLLQLRISHFLQTGRHSEEVYQLIMKALELTLPNFSIHKIKDYLLSRQEICLLIPLSQFHNLNGNVTEAITIHRHLKSFFDEKVVDVIKKGQLYPQVLSNLASYLCDIENYEEVLNVTAEGIELCRKTNYFYCLPDLYWSKTEALFGLGLLTESKETAKTVYNAYTLFERTYEKELFKKYAEETLGVQF